MKGNRKLSEKAIRQQEHTTDRKQASALEVY